MPSPLICIVALTIVAVLFNIDVRTVGDMGELPDTLPIFLWPEVPLNLETLMIILPYSISVGNGWLAGIHDDRHHRGRSDRYRK